MSLAGYRILDLGIITAGAATGALLADLGAEVIKVESPTYRDPFRSWAPGDLPTGDAGMSPFFRATNRNKRAISINLKEPEGRAVFLRLVASSHAVVENFRRGVMGRLGLDFATLKAANPNIVLASISSQGETGPDAGHVSYGSTLEAVGGMAWSMGYPGGPPAISGRDVNYPDQVVAIFAAGMMATALGATRRDGAVHLDLSQRELTSFLGGETILAAAAGQGAQRSGNAQPEFVLQDCFAAADGRFVAVSVRADDLSALYRLTGSRDPASGLPTWIAASGSARLAADALTAIGIAAAPVLNGAELLALKDKGWSWALHFAEDGGTLKGFPFQREAQPLAIRRDAPSIGADTEEVLREVGRYSGAEIAVLADKGIVEI